MSEKATIYLASSFLLLFFFFKRLVWDSWGLKSFLLHQLSSGLDYGYPKVSLFLIFLAL